MTTSFKALFDLTGRTALFGDVGIACLIGDIEYAQFALCAYPLANIVGEAARLDALADHQHLVAGAQSKPVIDHLLGDIGLAPHEWKAAEQDGAAPPLLLDRIHDHFAEAADIVGLHPVPRAFTFDLHIHDARLDCNNEHTTRFICAAHHHSGLTV